MSDPSIADVRELMWQCRRGIKEVEVVLVPFLQRHYPALSDERKALFVRLLDCEDADMFEWFTERSEAEDKLIQGMVDEILQKLAADAQPYQQ